MSTARTLIVSLALLVVVLLPASANPQTAGNAAMPADCSECHTCGVPTARETCLKSCPRTQMVHMSSKHQLREAPGMVQLDSLADLYLPVEFNHKAHAGMAEMGLDCATCHHFSPPGIIPPCSDCHEPAGNAADLNKPNLKGAYHRQCLACHREWSHDTKCVVCHAPSEKAKLATAPADPTDIVGTVHPEIPVPATKVFTTPYQAGPVVTFQHKEHVDLFGFQCTDCHIKENCADCHDITEGRRPARTQQEVHAMCNGCHAKDPCAKCHDTKERPGFTHNRTGFPLTGYHQQLGCWACHPKAKRMTRIDSMCRSCHAKWSPETFKHHVTGLVLDEVHAEIDCDACHPDHRYDASPVCDTCHDDGRTADSAPPGVHSAQTKRSEASRRGTTGGGTR